MSRGYRLGYGKFRIESVDSIGFGSRNNIFAGDMVYNRALLELGRLIHVGKMVTFGNGMYEIEV